MIIWMNSLHKNLIFILRNINYIPLQFLY